MEKKTAHIHKNRNIIILSMFFSILNKTTLIFQIHNATPADSGEYACIATSELGSVITKATLTVLGKVFSVKHYEVITRRLNHLRWRHEKIPNICKTKTQTSLFTYQVLSILWKFIFYVVL